MAQDNSTLPPNFNPQGHTPLGVPPPPQPVSQQSITPPGNPGNGGSGQQYQIRWEPTFNTPFTPGPPNTPPVMMEEPPTTELNPPVTQTNLGAAPLIVEGIVDDCMRSITASFETAANPNTPIIFNAFVNGTWRGSATGIVTNISDPFNQKFKISAEVPLSICSLKIGDLVQSAFSLNGRMTGLGPGVRVVSHVPYSVLTQHYNNERTGWYPYAGLLWAGPLPGGFNSRFKLNTANVGLLVESIKLPVDGKSYAQPLYMHHQFFPNLGTSGEPHNAVFLATENDSVIAYDADDPGSDGKGVLLWVRPGVLNQPLFPNSRPLLPPGFAPVDSELIPQGDIPPPVGISSTPVIDCGCDNSSDSSTSNKSNGNCCCSDSGSKSNSTNCGCCRTATIYVVSKSQRSAGPKDENATFHFFLHALDVTTGYDRPNSPVEITGQVPGTSKDGNDGKGNIIFDPRFHNNRAGLLLLNGTIYIGFASHQDVTPYHGWVISYDAVTLEQKNIFCTTPDGTEGGIWQSEMGLASDGQSIYFCTGNGSFDGKRDFGDTVLKLSPDLNVLSWFAPANQAEESLADADLGSGGVMIIPGDAISSPNLLVTGGKDGQIFLLDRTNLGGFDSKGGYNNNPNSVQTMLIRPKIQQNKVDPDANPGVWGGPAYYNGPNGPTVFFCGNGTRQVPPALPQLVGFALNNSNLTFYAENPFDTFPQGGATPIVSSDQQADQTGILWVVQRDSGGTFPHKLSLRAYDPNFLTQLLFLFNNQYGTWSGRAFIEPTVINGKVYVASEDHISVFF